MEPPEFPEKLRIVIEPKWGVFRNGFRWSIEGLRPGDEDTWVPYGWDWSTGLHDMGTYEGWRSTVEKAEKSARKRVDLLCKDQCALQARYEKWKEGYATIDIECDGCP